MPRNDPGLLLEDLMLQGGVDISHIIRRPYDGIGRDHVARSGQCSGEPLGRGTVARGESYNAAQRDNLEIPDRVGGGDSFASGRIYGFLSGEGPAFAVEYGAAHGAPAMTTPGDTSMASRNEVKKLMAGGSARVDR